MTLPVKIDPSYLHASALLGVTTLGVVSACLGHWDITGDIATGLFAILTVPKFTQSNNQDKDVKG